MSDDKIIARAFRLSLVLFVLLIVIMAVIFLLQYFNVQKNDTVKEAVVTGPVQLEEKLQVDVPALVFTDITDEAGIDFMHVNGAVGDKLLPESMGSGVAFLDYNRDGLQDLLFVNAKPWENYSTVDTPTMALYKNLGHTKFENVTDQVGLDIPFYGVGVATGDFNADGWTDVFITAVGENKLFQNFQGVFQDVTEKANVAGNANDWSTSAAFIDIDNDGDLDLFVANYVVWSKSIDFEINFQLTGVGRAYGPPTTFAGTYPILYQNEGNGHFKDISEKSGVQIRNASTGAPMAKALGVAPMDIDNDGWIDIFIANDTVQNFLLHNQGNGIFQEEGVNLGIAFDRNGNATGAMGVDFSFYRNTPELGLAVGNFANEMTSLYVQQGEQTLFADEAIIEGIGPQSRKALTFGLFFFDADLDGRQDLLQANGHLEEQINLVQSSQHYAQPAQLFWNCGNECETSFLQAQSVGDLSQKIVGRGAAYADIDLDGDLDVVLTQVGGKPLLLRNDQQTGNHWLRLKLQGKAPNLGAIGATVTVETKGIKQFRQVMPARSYLSQTELPIVFGTGQAQQVDLIRIRWPNGEITEITNVQCDQQLTIEQGVPL